MKTIRTLSYSNSPQYISILFLLICFSSSHANDEVNLSGIDSELLLFFDESELVTVATKSQQNARNAPAITTVIDEEEIRRSGARNILDILKRIPGIQILRTPWQQSIIVIRGLKNLDSATVKFLINGQSVNDNLSGGAMYRYDNISIENIKRIEIMRGPGSALYGANAFTGIINIITKKGRDIDGTSINVTNGSNNTQGLSYQIGNQGAYDLSFSLDYAKTDGSRSYIEQDILAQSGHARTHLERLDSSFQITYKKFNFNTRYIESRKNPNLSVGNALNDKTSLEETVYFFNLSYEDNALKDSHLKISTYLNRVRGQYKWELFPEGSYNFGAGLYDYPNGVLGHPIFKEKDAGIEFQLDTPWLEFHNLTTGIIHENRRTHGNRNITNFNPLTYIPLEGGLQDVTSWANYTTPSTRKINAIYIQDSWLFSDTLTITTGIRHDHYSDFGQSTNPRLAFVWQLNKNWYTKLLAGSAFRAPAYAELYVKNNPVVSGNKELQPEKMHTYEFATGYNSLDSNFRVTLFYNRFKNRITAKFNPDLNLLQYQNSGGAKLMGLESEFEHRWSDTLSIYANATFLDTEDVKTKRQLNDISHISGNIGVNVRLNQNNTINAHLLANGPTKRAPGDDREELSGSGVVNLTYSADLIRDTITLRAAIYNLFNKETHDPTDAGSIPNDLPNEDRSYTVNLGYKF